MRDLLHIQDLVNLIEKQIARIEEFRGQVFNVGGSTCSSLSLQETTALCQKITGNKVNIDASPVDRPADIIWYVTDNGDTEATFQWKPERNPETILTDIFDWLHENEHTFTGLLKG